MPPQFSSPQSVCVCVSVSHPSQLLVLQCQHSGALGEKLDLDSRQRVRGSEVTLRTPPANTANQSQTIEAACSTLTPAGQTKGQQKAVRLRSKKVNLTLLLLLHHDINYDNNNNNNHFHNYICIKRTELPGDAS